MTHGYSKGVLTSSFIPLLLNSFDLPCYNFKSRKIHTNAVADVTKSRTGGFCKLPCQGEYDLTWEGFVLEELGLGENCGLMKSLQVNGTIFSNFFKC